MLLRITVLSMLLTLAGSAQDRPMFSSRSQLVLVHATVKDSRGAYVTGLTKDRFIVYDNNRPQSIRFFLDEDAPVTIGLLVDSSASMLPNRELVVAAAASFVQTSHSRDEVFALAFGDEVRAALPLSQPFTSDAGVLRTALQAAITPRGRTAMHDALAKGLEYVNGSGHVRKVLVLVSDGDDNASVHTLEEVVPKLQAANVVVYAIAIEDPLLHHRSRGRLKQLTAATGGEVHFPGKPAEVQAAFQQIARDIRQAYVVAFEPEDGIADGFHAIRVVAADERWRPLSVRARSGYLAQGRE